jgi:hypothetical protein
MRLNFEKFAIQHNILKHILMSSLIPQNNLRWKLAPIPDDPAGLDIKCDLTNIQVGLVSKAGGKMHKAVHVGKVCCQANRDTNSTGTFISAMLNHL